MEVIKLGTIKIPASRTLSDYYELKHKYELMIQKQRLNKKPHINRKCLVCGNPKGLEFYARQNCLYSVCQTPTCSNNIIIPIHKYTTYENEYDLSKQKYDASVQTILRNKFDILFNYKQSKDVDIEPIRNAYLNSKEYMNLLEQSYQYILESSEKQEKRIHAYHMRDQIIKEIKKGSTSRLLSQLHEVLKTIHELNYSKIEISGQVDIIHMEYSMQNLELKRTATSVEPVEIILTETIDTDTISFTFGDCVENGSGHIHGPRGQINHGLELKELEQAYFQCKQRGLSPHLIDLRELLPKETKSDPAYLLICEGWATSLSKSLMDEHINLKWNTKSKMKVKNKTHICYAEFTQTDDSGRGQVYSWNDVPVLSSIRDELPRYFGELTEKLPAEGNKYTDEKENVFHGDERVIAISLRIGSTKNIQYQWYKNNKPVGFKGTMELPNGTLYAMSHKASGNDWKKLSLLTLRHAFGDNKFLKMEETDTIPFDQLPDIYSKLSDLKVRSLVKDLLSSMEDEDLVSITPKQIREQIEESEDLDLSDWKTVIKEEASSFINLKEKPKEQKK